MRYLLLWIPVLALVIAAILVSDAARFRSRGRICGQGRASLVFVMLVTGYVALSIEMLAFDSLRQALLIGIAWALITVATDLLVARLTMAGRWREILSPYDPREGHYWGAALLWIAIVPPLLHLLLP